MQPRARVPRRRLSSALAIVPIAIAVLALGRAVAPDPDQPISPVPARQWTALTIVGLGDSVPAASGCPCTSFVTLLGARVTRDIGAPVSVQNLGTPGQTSSRLLAALGDAQPAAEDVAGADLITITIGANDFHWSAYSSGHCGGADGLGCYQPEMMSLRANLKAIIDRIKALRSGRPTAIRVTGYWNIWKDGAVALRWGPQYVRVGDALTRQVNRTIADVAEEEGVTFVDIYTPFKGATGSDDDTWLLAPDGDHPSQQGHQLIADALADAGLAPLLPFPQVPAASMR
jgi:lysophospholipase L1-like esterase